MKKTMLLILAVLISVAAFSQTGTDSKRTPLQKLIVDVGAIPIQVAFKDKGSLKSFNFALGYEITRKLDLRFNYDLNNFYNQNLFFQNNNQNLITKLTGLSFGVNYNVLNDVKFIYDHSALDVLAKFGIDINDYSEQETLFYDLSVRLKMKDLPYVGIGYNHHIFDSIITRDVKGVYLTFGLEF